MTDQIFFGWWRWRMNHVGYAGALLRNLKNVPNVICLLQPSASAVRQSNTLRPTYIGDFVACSGICLKYKSSRSHSCVTKYHNGRKRCNTCDVYLKWDGVRCPCCSRILRTRPKHFGTRNQTSFDRQVKRM